MKIYTRFGVPYSFGGGKALNPQVWKKKHKNEATQVFGGHRAPAAGPTCELLEAKAAVRGRDSRDMDLS